jgi:hypothetical protein
LAEMSAWPNQRFVHLALNSGSPTAFAPEYAWPDPVIGRTSRGRTRREPCVRAQGDYLESAHSAEFGPAPTPSASCLQLSSVKGCRGQCQLSSGKFAAGRVADSAVASSDNG